MGKLDEIAGHKLNIGTHLALGTRTHKTLPAKAGTLNKLLLEWGPDHSYTLER